MRGLECAVRADRDDDGVMRGVQQMVALGPTDDLSAYASIRQELTVPIAGGESVASPGEAAAAVAVGAFDIIQPDASICGGVAPLPRIAAAARARGIACIPPACDGAISLAATLQALAVLARQSPELEAGPLLGHDVGENPCAPTC